MVKNAGPFFASRSIEIRKGIEDAQKLRADAETRAAAMDARLANLRMEVEAMRESSQGRGCAGRRRASARRRSASWPRSRPTPIRKSPPRSRPRRSS